MTPLQKLVRVQDIGKRLKELEAECAGPDELAALHEEFNRLLAGAERPPAELIGAIDPATWANAFTERYAGHAPETMLPWFDAAMASAHARGRTQGQEEGAESGAKAVQNLIDVARLTLLLHDQGRQRLASIRDDTNPDAPPDSLAERLRRALEALGVECVTPF